MSFTPRKLFVTTALPYANGPFHIGHIMEYIQADIWVRFQRHAGARGALRLRRRHPRRADHAQGREPRASRRGADRARGRDAHRSDLAGFHVSFDHFHSTHSPENVALAAGRSIAALKEAGFIATRTIEQFFDPVKGMFLPDRYIKGECPKCGAKDQYGDSCENCSAVYAPTDLKNPYSTLVGRHAGAEEVRALLLPALRPALRRVPAGVDARTGACSPRSRTRCASGSSEAARGSTTGTSRATRPTSASRSRSPGQVLLRLARRADRLPREPQDTTSSRQAASDFANFLADPKLEQIHFIGKDIIYFHTLFWPAMLKFAGPTRCRTTSTCTASSRSPARRCRSRAARASARRRYLELGPEPRVAALLPRRQAQRPRRGPRLQSRRLPRAGEQRPRRQVREHREPRGGVPHAPLRRQARHARRAASDRANRLTIAQTDAELARATTRRASSGECCAR